ncbi:sentrin-specific protease 1-like [Ctenocephalides felis]|uniref:sentrin-specific protease 1-like n=1 Tax=Ctenocephalides felis TaxID=7515 RepID=UPI000E6E4FF2|nr:sentrin-specific protease 1-like [Ctenocephalides felis]
MTKVGEDIADNKSSTCLYCDESDSSNSPPAAKRLRLTMNPGGFVATTPAEPAPIRVHKDPKCWVNAHILKQNYLKSLQASRSSSSLNIYNKYAEELGLYKSLVNSSQIPSPLINSRTKSTKTKPKLNDGIICIESDDSDDDVVVVKSDDDVIVVNSSELVEKAEVVDDSSDSEVIEVSPQEAIKKNHNRKSILDGKSFKDLQISNVINLETDSEDEDVILAKQLDKEQEDVVRNAFYNGPSREKLITKFSITITREDIKCLQHSEWLNDQVINFYLNLIMERSQRNDLLPKVYVMSTFFFTKLCRGEFESLRRWTRKVDLFSYDLIPIPFNQNDVHWCLFLINMKKKVIEFYDSLGHNDIDSSKKLLQYLSDELWDKKHQILDVNKWKLSCMKGIPQQLNGTDCGVFTCTNAEYLTRNASLSFTQQDMPYFRKKMCFEIVQGSLLT